MINLNFYKNCTIHFNNQMINKTKLQVLIEAKINSLNQCYNYHKCCIILIKNIGTFGKLIENTVYKANQPLLVFQDKNILWKDKTFEIFIEYMNIIYEY